jgi:CubicO group peptidase (beta-lactamase class C family)
MRVRWTGFLLLAILTMGCATVSDSGIDSLMRDYQGDVPGASVLVLRDGEAVFRKSYGLADVDARIAATPATHYRLASVTKQFTAAAVLLLAERGELSLDDPLLKHLPSLPSAVDPVTLRHLLTHTSGLVDYEDVMPEKIETQLRDVDVLRLLEGQPRLSFVPGTSYRYSNSAYALLALVVEKVSGRSFATFLREEIFLPNGMQSAVAHEEGVSTVRSRAYGHSREGTAWKRTDQSSTSAVLGDGGIYASIDELTHWLRALEAGRFAEASVPRVATDEPGMKYGYGFRLHEHRGRKVISHTGETIGFRNALVRFPDQRIAVVVLTNRNEGESLKLALAIADRFLTDLTDPSQPR